MIGPGPISPSKWLPWIWDADAGEHEPDFADEEDFRETLGLIVRLMNRLVEAFDRDPRLFEPVFAGKDISHAEQWCEGFLIATDNLDIETWTVLFDRPTKSDDSEDVITHFVQPLLRLGTEDGRELSAMDGLAQQWVDSIVPCLVDIQDFWRTWNDVLSDEPDEEWGPVEVPYRREAPRVGRNDPCPCGSGRKFKKCCGRVPSLP